MIDTFVIDVAAGALFTRGLWHAAKLARWLWEARPTVTMGYDHAIGEDTTAIVKMVYDEQLRTARMIDAQMWDNGKGAFWFDPSRYAGAPWDWDPQPKPKLAPRKTKWDRDQSRTAMLQSIARQQAQEDYDKYLQALNQKPDSANALRNMQQADLRNQVQSLLNNPYSGDLYENLVGFRNFLNVRHGPKR